MSARTSLWLALGTIGLTFIAWGFTLTLPFTGADAWSILAQGDRFLARPIETAGARYLDGMWEGARFWRPGTVAVAGVQRAAFGENPFFYHLVRLLAVALTAFLVGRAAASSQRAPVAGFAAAAIVYLLHPVQAETIPAFARDADTYFTLATVASILLLSGAREAASMWPVVAGVACALLAATFKEPGLLAPILGAVALEPWRSREPNAMRAWIATLVLAAGLVGHIAFRWITLGTIGGYEDTIVEITVSDAARILVLTLLDHQRIGVLWPAAIFLVGLGLVISGRSAPLPESRASRRWIRVRLACFAWLAISALVFVQAARFRTRYAEALLAPIAILLGGLVAQFTSEYLTSVRAGGSRLAPSAPALATVLALGFILASGGRPLWSYPQWEIAGRTGDLLMSTIEDAVVASRASGAPETKKAGRFAVTAASFPDGSFSLGVEPFPFKIVEPSGRLEAGLSTVVITARQGVLGFAEVRELGHLRTIYQGQPALDVSLRDIVVNPE